MISDLKEVAKRKFKIGREKMALMKGSEGSMFTQRILLRWRISGGLESWFWERKELSQIKAKSTAGSAATPQALSSKYYNQFWSSGHENSKSTSSGAISALLQTFWRIQKEIQRIRRPSHI